GMSASGELPATARPGLEPAARQVLHLTGVAIAEGIGLGHVVLHEPRVVVTNFIADDVPKELRRLEAAVDTLRADLDVMLERGDVADGGEHRDVLEAFRMFAYDRGWMRRLSEAVMTGLTAEAAVERGLVLEEGGPTSHVAIVARALGIAAVAQIENAVGLVDAGDAIIVDGTEGHLHIRPPPDIQSAYGEKVRFRARRQAQYSALRHL